MANPEHLEILARGVDVWNEWRSVYREVKPNLEKANLQNLHFPKANLSLVNLAGANLSYANLSRAELSFANLSTANLLGANLLEANLLGAKLLKADLSNADIKKARLSGTDLSDAKLIKAKLSEVFMDEVALRRANLKDADLARAILYEVNLLNADLTGAILTGVCLKDCHTNKIKFDNIICEYIFLDYDYTNDKTKNRCPASGSFAPGEFVTLLQRIQDTIDLVFLDGIDWKAFAATFLKVQSEVDGGELLIQAIEKKYDRAFVIRVSVPASADKAETERKLKQEYESQLKLLDKSYRAQMQAKDEEILFLYKEQIKIVRQHNTDLVEITKNLANQQSRVENTINVQAQAMAESSKYNLSNAQFAGGFAETVQGNQQGGTINNFGKNQDLADAAAEIQRLLEQLSLTQPIDTLPQKALVVEQAIAAIDANPTLKQRVLAALKSGSIEALKEMLHHPLVNILIAALEGWQEGK